MTYSIDRPTIVRETRNAILVNGPKIDLVWIPKSIASIIKTDRLAVAVPIWFARLKKL